jgi:hypothetical protein
MNAILSYQIRYTDDEKTIPSGIEEVVTPTDNPTLEMLQGAVDGLIETLGRIRSPFRDNVEIDAYVNQEGLLMSLPMVMAIYDEYGARPFAGNIVFVGGDSETGDSVALTEDEIDFIRDRIRGTTFLLLD